MCNFSVVDINKYLVFSGVLTNFIHTFSYIKMVKNGIKPYNQYFKGISYKDKSISPGSLYGSISELLISGTFKMYHFIVKIIVQFSIFKYYI